MKVEVINNWTCATEFESNFRKKLINHFREFAGRTNRAMRTAESTVISVNLVGRDVNVRKIDIHYLTREFRVKLHLKTDIARIAKK